MQIKNSFNSGFLLNYTFLGILIVEQNPKIKLKIFSKIMEEKLKNCFGYLPTN